VSPATPNIESHEYQDNHLHAEQIKKKMAIVSFPTPEIRGMNTYQKVGAPSLEELRNAKPAEFQKGINRQSDYKFSYDSQQKVGIKPMFAMSNVY
jgi:hypothetical protein